MTSNTVDEWHPWQLVRAALPRRECDAIPFSELWLRCQVAPHLVDAGLDALRQQPGGTVHQSANKFWYQWRRREGDL